MNDRRLVSTLAALACSYPATAWAHGGWEGVFFLLSLFATPPLMACALIMWLVARFSRRTVTRRIVAGVGGALGVIGGAWIVVLQGLDVLGDDLDSVTGSGVVLALVSYAFLGLVFVQAYRLWRPVEGAEAG